MAKDKLVIQSVATDDGRRCVDIFQRPDGSFGFQEYIREPEENSGWQPVSYTSQLHYRTQEEAMAAARARTSWLNAD
ncbi:MAG: hypothetical protein NWT00_04465 [Beijerinckiaceae bacterium]|jgi:hypothetical protein|nr:hypothetical protein [Beijerinckiaceae bacterium]